MARECVQCGAAFEVKPATARYGQGLFCNRKCYAAWMGGNGEGRHTRGGGGGKREDLGGQYFRSRWEANYARYLNWLIANGQGGIKSWQFEPDTFEFDGIKRGVRFYTPDFKVELGDGSIEYHEIKGWMDAKSATKLRRMAKYHPNVKIVLIDSPAFRALARDVHRFVPGWEVGGKTGNAGKHGPGVA